MHYIIKLLLLFKAHSNIIIIAVDSVS